MNICIYSEDYPSKKRICFTFVKQLVDEFARKGHHCCVISPFSVTHNKCFCKSFSSYTVDGGNEVFVIRPNYYSFSTCHIGSFYFSDFFYQRALVKAQQSVPFTPDIIYAHFWRQGFIAQKYALSIKKPLFVATGESNISSLLPSDVDTKAIKDFVRGVICVSTKNKIESINLGLTVPEKCIVVPNSVNTSIFRKLNREECRRRLGLPENVFIIGYVGWFNERKGIYRVLEALKRINGETVYSILIGGHAELDNSSVLVMGRIPHNDLPYYLNAADIFVLPTLEEGCCNAIVEALACGLPVISSNRPFNWDILDENNSIMIDPENINEIASAIIDLRDNIQKRESLSVHAIETARLLEIENRASRIIDFIRKKL